MNCRIRPFTCLWKCLGVALGLSSFPAPGHPAPGPVVYGDLADKGLSPEAVLKTASGYQPSRPRPAVQYLSQTPDPSKPGSAVREKVLVKLPDSGDEVMFGFPMAKGALFDLQKIRLLTRDSRELPTQATALALWPDGSVKSALLQSLNKGPAREIEVEFGQEVHRTGVPEPTLRVQESESAFVIDTGKLQVTLRKDAFFSFTDVSVQSPSGAAATTSQLSLRLIGENREAYLAAPPETFTIERQGPLDVVFLARGKYRSANGDTLMRYASRLRFVAGAARMEWTITHINDQLDREFTDIRALTAAIGVSPTGAPEIALEQGIAKPKASGQATQWSEDRFVTDLDGRLSEGSGHLPGAAQVATGKSASLRVGVQDFWQRWPKSLAATPGEITVGLLPEQPSDAFGRALPPHLVFPFVGGCYRMKWGMSFTERLSLDLDASGSLADFSRRLADTPGAILPPDYVARTGVFADVGLAPDLMAQAYASYMDASLIRHHQQRDKQREYGFLNWGDWFGERGRNWGNNEYDRAHGFFTYYLLSGHRAFHDDALRAARHQADVDIVHAYPDPYYVGTNHQHSIGHTGVWSERVNPAIWSHAYDSHTSAGNGHTWTDGLADAWLLTGDPVVMESLRALGEHITFAFAPSFSKLGSHERSAGWSLRAIMGAYRATGDPAYLDAARTIAAVPLAQWDEATGTLQLSHELPADHASGTRGIVGNSVYNIGILLMGLAELHRETQDARTLAYMKAAADWLAKCWDSRALAWPYSCDADGRALTPVAPNLNPLLYPALAYIGLHTRDQRLLGIAQDACLATFPPGSGDVLAKEMSIKAFATTETLGALAEAERLGLLEAHTGFEKTFRSVGFPTEISFRDSFPLKLVLSSLKAESALTLTKLKTPNSGVNTLFTLTAPIGTSLEKWEIPSALDKWTQRWQPTAAEPSSVTLSSTGDSTAAFRLAASDCDVALPGDHTILIRDRGIRRWELQLPSESGVVLEIDGSGAGAFFPGADGKITRQGHGNTLTFHIPSSAEWTQRPRRIPVISWNNEITRVTLKGPDATLLIISTKPEQ